MFASRHSVVALASCLCLCVSGVNAQTKRTFKPGPWKKRHAPEGWVIHHSPHYQIQSQAGQEKAERLANHMEGMYRVYRKLFPPDKSSFKRYTIKLFKDRSEFMRYGAKANAGAYYSPVEREMVCYDTGKWMDERTKLDSFRGILRRGQMDILGAAAHEGWHQYFHWYITSWVPIPPWINEGMGDYFYCARPIKVKGRKMPAQLGQLNELRLPFIWSAVKSDKHVPIKQLLDYSQSDYYRNSVLCYAEGWALCHFLLHSGNKDYARVIPHFVHLVRSDTNMDKITKKAFRGIDLDQLEKDWKAWLLNDAIRELTGKTTEQPQSATKSQR